MARACFVLTLCSLAVPGAWLCLRAGRGATGTETAVRPAVAAAVTLRKAETADDRFSLRQRMRELQTERDGEKRGERTAMLIAELLAADPRAALDALARLPASEVVNDVSTGLLCRWTETALGAAAAWAGQITDPAERSRALQTVAGEAVRTDALVALCLMVAEPASAARDALLRRAAMELAVDDPDAFAAWADATPQGPLRDELLAGVALVWSERDPHQAAIIAGGDLPEGRLRDDTLVGIAQRWVQSDPARAAAWVATWPADQARVAAIENVAITWSLKDSDAADRWLEGLVHQAGNVATAGR